MYGFLSNRLWCILLNTSGCGGDLTDASGSFNSPGFPGPYPHNRECVWRISVDSGSRIKLQLSQVDLEFHSNCSYDFLEVLLDTDFIVSRQTPNFINFM